MGQLRLRRHEQGFALFETLVALVIAGLVIGVLARILSVSALETRAIGETFEASILARSLIAGVRAETLSDDVSREGSASSYRWRLAARRVDLPDLPPPAAATPNQPADRSTEASHGEVRQPLFQVDVDVAAPSGRRLRLQALVANRRPEAPTSGEGAEPPPPQPSPISHGR